MITGIGSLPFTDINEAIDLIFSTCRTIPFWPQLPKRSPVEDMYIPFLENVPCVTLDKEKNTVYMDTNETEGIEQFYEDFSNGTVGSLSISEGVAPGFYRFIERLKEIQSDVRFIKCQLTGPFSMGLGLKDEKGKPIIYNYGYFDIIKKALHMKAKWMVGTIRSRYPEKDIIIFFDEPYLVSFGSAYVSIPKEEVSSLIDEVTAGIDALRGVHCCGNTDWSILFSTSLDIINYDAFNFMETIFYYMQDLERFTQRGGIVSPGVVPSSEDVIKTTTAALHALLDNFTSKLSGASGASSNAISLVTTSCGLGSLGSTEAVRAMELLKSFE